MKQTPSNSIPIKKIELERSPEKFIEETEEEQKKFSFEENWCNQRENDSKTPSIDTYKQFVEQLQILMSSEKMFSRENVKKLLKQHSLYSDE